MRRPTIKKGPASLYAMEGETIREFSTPSGKGGLISIRDTGDGTVTLCVYQLDAGVIVSVDPKFLVQSDRTILDPA